MDRLPILPRRGAALVLIATLFATILFAGSGASPALAVPANFHIEGGGFGHGVGMSQYGALGYAQQGFDYQSILTHYYAGTQIETKSNIGDVNVWLGADTTAPADAVVTTTGATSVVVGNNGVAPDTVLATVPSGKTISVTANGGKFDVVADGQTFSQVGDASHKIYVQYNASPATLDLTGHAYKYGQFEFSIPDGTSLRVVLISMNIENYLKGLGEVPSSWPAAALQAQAVAARTYGVQKLGASGNNRAVCGCGLYGDTRDQNYIGYDKETGSGGANWTAAVAATANQWVTYNGAAIQAFYASSSGGFTENSERVFKTALPYLKGAQDPYDAANGQNSLYSWKRDISGTDMQTWLNADSRTAVGSLSNVEFLQPTGTGGRLISNIADYGGGVRITGSGGTKTVGGDTFRGIVNAGSGSQTKLPSALMHLSDGNNGPYGAFPGGVFVAAGPLAGGDTDRIVTGADSGGGPHVRVLDANGNSTGVEFNAYEPGFLGGVRVAVCNFGEAGQRIVTAPGPTGGPHIRVFNASGAPEGNGFFAYDPAFNSGLYVACGDVDPTHPGDEIITGAGAGGGPHVRVFDQQGNVLSEFFAYDAAFIGGVRVAAANGTIVTGAGTGGGPHVQLFTEAGARIAQWFAYGSDFLGGIYVAAGNVSGDANSEIITGAGESGGAHVRVFNLVGGDVASFFAFQTGNDHGARVAAAHVPGNAVVSGSGKGGPSHLSINKL